MLITPRYEYSVSPRINGYMDLVLNVVFDLVDDLKGNKCGETLPAAVSGSEVLKAQETSREDKK